MKTRERILLAIKKFNDQYNGQVNLDSEAAQTDLAGYVYDAVLKQLDLDEPGTFNKQQMELFSYNPPGEHK